MNFIAADLRTMLAAGPMNGTAGIVGLSTVCPGIRL
jgi:hypothetical protein